MYNLLVHNSSEAWNGDPLTLETGRCVREYTDDNITEKLSALTKEQVNEIRRMPCIFAYESHNKLAPHFGLIKDAVRRRGEVRVEYELVPLTKFLTFDEISGMEFDLDISKWEMNRTHWAIKDISLPKELAPLGIRRHGMARLYVSGTSWNQARRHPHSE